jgi:hypothetical protein
MAIVSTAFTLKGEIYARFLGRGSCAPTLKVVPAGEIGFAVVICTDGEDAMISTKVLFVGDREPAIADAVVVSCVNNLCRGMSQRSMH